MTIDVKHLQQRLGVATDGVLGRNTLRALFARAGAGPERAGQLALGANVHLRTYGILDSALRLTHFMGQTTHESGGFRYMEELGGPAYFARYDGRKDLGNTQPGDGNRYHGRGPIQLTGRANYTRVGNELGLPFADTPDLVALPAIGILVAAKFWSDHGLNELADSDDLRAITRKINGGFNGLSDREARTAAMKALIL